MDRKQRGNAVLWILLAVILGVVGYFVRDAMVGVTLEEVTPETKFDKAIADNLIGALVAQDYIVDPDRDENGCCWPETCWSKPASEQLEEIRQWVEEAEIDAEQKDRLFAHVDRCLDPELESKDLIPVCRIHPPGRDPCYELYEDIYVPASEANGSPEPEEAWQNVENEFEQFPGDR